MRKIWTTLMAAGVMAGGLLGAGRVEANCNPSSCNSLTCTGGIGVCDCTNNNDLACEIAKLQHLTKYMYIDKGGNTVFSGTNVLVVDGSLTESQMNDHFIHDSSYNSGTGAHESSTGSCSGGVNASNTANGCHDFQLGAKRCSAGSYEDCGPLTAGTCASGSCQTSLNDGKGNLIVGNLDLTGQSSHKLNTRTGDQNLLVGNGHHFESNNGLIAGFENHIRTSSNDSSVVGGQWNHVKSARNVIVGGLNNMTDAKTCNANSGIAAGLACHVDHDCDALGKTTGWGCDKTCTSEVDATAGDACDIDSDCDSGAETGFCVDYGQGDESQWHVIVGGERNGTGQARSAAVLGGNIAEARGRWSSVVGGFTNQALSDYSAVVAGAGNNANGRFSAIVGGGFNL